MKRCRCQVFGSIMMCPTHAAAFELLAAAKAVNEAKDGFKRAELWPRLVAAIKKAETK